MMSKKMMRVICIIMAALMLLSVVAVVLQVIAADEAAVVETFVNPATGDSDSDYYIPAGIAVAAILAVIVCLVLPKIKKGENKSVQNRKLNTSSAKTENGEKSAVKTATKPVITKTKK